LDTLRYGTAIIAVGFGEEASHSSVDCKPYWRDDDLHQRLRSGGTVFVSGTGDGGLIDVLRSCILDFSYEKLVDIARLSRDKPLVQSLVAIEVDRARYPDGRALSDALLALAVPAAIDDALRATLKPGTHVTLNGLDQSPFDRASSLLNRFLVSRLIHLGAITYVGGAFSPAHVRPEGSSLKVTVGAFEGLFDHVVVRHGPRPAAIDAFGSLATSLTTARNFFKSYRYIVDRTRHPLWDEILPIERASSGATPTPVGGTVDQRLRNYVSEGAQAALKSAIGTVRTGVLVRREPGNAGTDRLIVEADAPLGVVVLDFKSASTVALQLLSPVAVAIVPQQVAAGDDAALLLTDVTRILRNFAYLMENNP